MDTSKEGSVDQLEKVSSSTSTPSIKDKDKSSRHSHAKKHKANDEDVAKKATATVNKFFSFAWSLATFWITKTFFLNYLLN